MAIEFLEERGTKTIVVGCSVFLGLCLLATACISWWQAERIKEMGAEAFRTQCGYTGVGPLVINESFNASYYSSIQGVVCYRVTSS